MKRFINYLKKYKWFYIFGTLAMLTGILLDIISPMMQKTIVDDMIIGGDTSSFKQTLLLLGAITLIRTAIGYLKEYMFDIGGSRTVMNLRQDLFDHIQALSFPFFDKENTGELMARIKDDAENVLFAAAFGAMVFVEQALGFTIVSVMLFTLNWKLALISLATMPVIGFIAVKLEKNIQKSFDKISDQGAILNTTAQENIAGVRLVKAFGREKYEIRKFLEKNRKNYELNQEQAGIWAKYYPGIEFISNMTIVTVICMGGIFVITGNMTVGTLVAFSNFILWLVWPMRLLGWVTGILSKCRSSLKKIDRIFNEKPIVKNPDNPIIPEKIQGHIVFDNVSLEYNGVPVLKNINIDAKPGSTVALMGMTGSGKSSVINLLGRFYEATGGKIYFDGVELGNMDLKTLRKSISFVMQDTFLFSDTIGENIEFGSEGLTEEEKIKAAEDANIHDFISSLPEGYETVIGERGIGLSGGQKQRISIARALAKKAKVLVLDDSTSALDMETEYRIQKALEKRKDVLKIIIAHRVSAVKNADEIIILEDGEIVERGTHNKLLELKGRYYETYCEQFQGMIDLSMEEVG